MNRPSSKLLFAGLLVIVAAAACAPAPTQQVYTRITEPSLKAGDAIPQPKDDTILTVSGKVGAANQDATIVMDLATIESAGLVDYDVTDPFEGNKVVFRGPLMSDLMAIWQVADDAQTLHVVALNDYVVDVPMADIRKYPVVFALQQDGVYMPIETRGPAMLVFPYDDFEFDKNLFNNYWAWQIKSIEVQ